MTALPFWPLSPTSASAPPSAAPSALAAFDPVQWFYTTQLAQRASQTTGPAQALLSAKLEQVLQDLQARWAEAQASHALADGMPAGTVPTSRESAGQHNAAGPSPLAQLLQEMHPTSGDASSAALGALRSDSPRVQQFRQQLGQLSVQKQVSKALSQAPQNAGPINSHMLVLRSLGLMRDASPDYLNRFMAYVNTLLCLDEAATMKAAPRKGAASRSTPPP